MVYDNYNIHSRKMIQCYCHFPHLPSYIISLCVIIDCFRYGGYLTDTSGNGGVSCRTDTNRIGRLTIILKIHGQQ